jgi:hypothetical protein
MAALRLGDSAVGVASDFLAMREIRQQRARRQCGGRDLLADWKTPFTNFPTGALFFATRKESTWHPYELLNPCRFSVNIRNQLQE